MRATCVWCDPYHVVLVVLTHEEISDLTIQGDPVLSLLEGGEGLGSGHVGAHNDPAAEGDVVTDGGDADEQVVPYEHV